MFTGSRWDGKNEGKTCGTRRPVLRAKVPDLRDLRAFQLAAEGLSQRTIARELGCSQPTVLRGIARATSWIANLVPDRRGEFTWLQRMRVAMVKQVIQLEHESRMAEREAAMNQEWLAESVINQGVDAS